MDFMFIMDQFERMLTYIGQREVKIVIIYEGKS